MIEIKETGIEGLVEVYPKIFGDDRGYFTEFYNRNSYSKSGIKDNFVQDNFSFSSKGVIRGLHLQFAPHEQGKLVRVVKGRVLDTVVDVRPDSPTFGSVYQVELNDKDYNALMVPAGFAHGFAALEDSLFLYKCSGLYAREFEGGIRWDDDELNIDWRVESPVISEKDRELPSFSEFRAKLEGINED